MNVYCNRCQTDNECDCVRPHEIAGYPFMLCIVCGQRLIEYTSRDPVFKAYLARHNGLKAAIRGGDVETAYGITEAINEMKPGMILKIKLFLDREEAFDAEKTSEEETSSEKEESQA